MPSPHPHNAPQPPTPRQQRHLRQLAEQTGTSFTPPATKAQASREIRRLLEISAALEEHPVFARIAIRERERRAVQADLQAGADDSVRHTRGETRGYGSSARWAHGARETDR